MANVLLKEGAGGTNQREGMTRETEESQEQGVKVQQEDIHLLQGERIGARKAPTNKRAEEPVHHQHLPDQGPQEDILRKVEAHSAAMWKKMRDRSVVEKADKGDRKLKVKEMKLKIEDRELKVEETERRCERLRDKLEKDVVQSSLLRYFLPSPSPEVYLTKS